MTNGTITQKAVEQLIDIRDSGAVNMFDMSGVQLEANEREMYELVIVIEDDGAGGYAELLQEVGGR